MRGGRPLRFLAATLGGWATVRAAMLWPEVAPLPEAIVGTLAPRAAAAIRPAAVPALSSAGIAAAPRVAAAEHAPRVMPAIAVASPTPLAPGTIDAVDPATAIPTTPTIPPPLVFTPRPTPPGRFAGSAWLIARDGAAGSLLGGQLGGSQAGVRLTYALGASRRLALAARLATPLSGRGREAAVGVDWKPFDAPVRLIAEQRMSLDGGRGGPTLGVVGGVGPTPIAAGFRLEAYGQAGVIARDRVEGFADGAARVVRPVATLAGVRMDLGAGAWGGLQRGARRIDVGPSIGIGLPVAGKTLRVTLDWRERIAGGAAPGSGPALSIGSDF